MLTNPKRYAHVVVGASYGDEGKGEVTSDICKGIFLTTHKPMLNILTNGGSQRGHTVICDNTFAVGDSHCISHVHHHFGSGTLFGADNLYSKYFIVNPMNFVREYDEFLELGFNPKSIKIYCDTDCLWSTPYDMLYNQFLEDCRGGERHGSVGVGIWETILRYNSSDMVKHVTLPEFVKMDHSEQVKYLIDIRQFYLNKYKFLGLLVLPRRLELFKNNGLYEHFIQDCKFFCDAVEFVKDSQEILQNYEYLVFENGQGLLLSSDPQNDHTTPSDTGCAYAIQMLKDSNLIDTDTVVHYITRPYITRHGAGDIDDECLKEDICHLIIPDSTNVTTEYQGHLRYAPLDVQALLKRTEKDFEFCRINIPHSKMKIDMTHQYENPNKVYEFKEVTEA